MTYFALILILTGFVPAGFLTYGLLLTSERAMGLGGISLIFWTMLVQAVILWEVVQ